MAAKKHSDTAVDLNIPYEQNQIQLKGIIGFGIGLFLLIVITFGLMWALLNVLTDYAEEQERATGGNPMALSDKERLPPEPRLQGAPGFGVESPNGRINMELAVPQAEYWELKKQWADLWANGKKDRVSGAVSAMPINEAKDKFLASGVKAKAGEQADKLAQASRRYFSEASSGRMASETRR